jgi:hypothetical protein
MQPLTSEFPSAWTPRVIRALRTHTVEKCGGRVNNLSGATPMARAVFFNDAPGGAARWWFAALDQRWFATGADRWLTQVVGIHEAGEDIWIQLETLGDQLRGVTVRVQPRMSLAEVVEAIETQIRSIVTALAK